MKKYICLLFLFLITSLAKAQIVDNKGLKGAWKEVIRTRDGQIISYRDTLFFEIISSNLCIWGKSTPTASRLRLKQIGTTLIIGPSEFEIIAQETNWMKLASDEGVEIEMIKYNNKKRPTVRKINTTKFKAGATVKMGIVPDKIEPFVGKWKCYKRTSDKPIINEQKYRILRLVEVVETAETIIAKMYGFEDNVDKPSWIVQNYENGILYTSGKDNREFKVINCQANELILENEGIVYFMNKL